MRAGWRKRSRAEVNPVPEIRVRARNAAPIRRDGAYVVYWMTSARRTSFNFALDRAVLLALELDRPLVILEALRCDYAWASDRIHRFVLEGMADNARALRAGPVTYYPYVEPRVGAGKGLLAALAARACVVVADEFPAFFLPSMITAAAQRLTVRLEEVDSNGLLPLRAADRAYPTAHAFRRHLQKTLPSHLGDQPRARPFASRRLREGPPLPESITRRWPPVSLDGEAYDLAVLPIDHTLAPAPQRGGTRAARAELRRFVDERLPHYHDARNEPGARGTSELSAYLHFGNISAHEVFAAVMQREEWSPARVASRASGSRSGWWGVSPDAEGFLDQLVTWRELGFNMCAHGTSVDAYESLPAWAKATLDRHARDPREPLYGLDELARAQTHDPLWNAAQRQLLREGRIHNYVRMLWGKKILEWTASPREALRVLIELNDRFALDGRDPNSLSGIFWILGRYDRPWGPERPVFGTIRYMSSANTARKYDVKEYLRTYGP